METKPLSSERAAEAYPFPIIPTRPPIVEERIYVLHTEVNVGDYLAIYSTEGLPLQRQILGGFLGYFTTEVGTQNQLVHFWAYQDLEDRRTRREQLAKEPAWQACLRKIRPMIKSMENRILVPTDFSPLPTAVLRTTA